MVLTLESQPKEIISLISNYLKQQDRYNLWLVNKRFNKIVDINLTETEYENIYRHLFLVSTELNGCLKTFSTVYKSNRQLVQVFYHQQFMKIYIKSINENMKNYLLSNGYKNDYDSNRFFITTEALNTDYQEEIVRVLYGLRIGHNKKAFTKHKNTISCIKTMTKQDYKKLFI